jgi:hypothetical protein
MYIPEDRSTLLLWIYSPLLDISIFLSFLIPYTVSWTIWTGDQPIVRPLPTHRTAQTQKKRTHTSMPRVGFETTIPAFEDGSYLKPRDVNQVYWVQIQNGQCSHPFRIQRQVSIFITYASIAIISPAFYHITSEVIYVIEGFVDIERITLITADGAAFPLN